MAKATKKPAKKTTTAKKVTKKTVKKQELDEVLVKTDINEDSNDAPLVKPEPKVKKTVEKEEETKKNKNFFAKMKGILWF